MNKQKTLAESVAQYFTLKNRNIFALTSMNVCTFLAIHPESLLHLAKYEHNV